MRVLIAMSGGVDSAVAASLLLKDGYEVIGVTLRLTEGEDSERENERLARLTAERLNIEFHVEDMRAEFKKQVINRFAEGYLAGLTPNPCIECNRYIKFGALFSVAEKYNCERLATGHYARIMNEKGTARLYKGRDTKKDQSYMLCRLSQNVLKKVLLPLGELTKDEVREKARALGFENAESRDSQDICFVENGKYGEVVEDVLGYTIPEGDFVDENGVVLGRHKGHIRYTIGQRKGLGLSLPSPLYVKEKDVGKNLVVLSEEKNIFTSSLLVGDASFINEMPKEKFSASVKIRYSQREEQAVITPISDSLIRLDFASPVRAAAKGQAAAIYINDEAVGGGMIL